MTSSRLPGKVLRPLAGRSVLGWVLRAAQAADQLDGIVVATSTDPEDDAVAFEAVRHDGVSVHRGPRDDVLARFCGVVDRDPAVAVVRLTADCPLLDPAVIDMIVSTWRANPGIDHLTTTNPRCLPRGLDVEIVSRRALEAVAHSATGPDRVHVTSAIYRQPDRYVVTGMVLHPDASDLRVTLDTPHDAALLEALVDLLGDRPPPWRDTVGALRAHPEMTALNADVVQKQWHEG
ncbi:MAG: NTP transferase domain-containing protein [Actinomycetota bacterium]|nr:NTP transferase domain-containing protein [Actinomycetota bacterium]